MSPFCSWNTCNDCNAMNTIYTFGPLIAMRLWDMKKIPIEPSYCKLAFVGPKKTSVLIALKNAFLLANKYVKDYTVTDPS